MNEYSAEPLKNPERLIFSVSEFSQTLHKNLQESIPLAWISGELSGVFHAQSGHVYATIKDSSSQIKIVIYQFVRKNIVFAIEEGLHVNICVQPALYKPRGELQLIVKAMEPEGLGALKLAFDQTKAKLLAEGLFEASRKKPLPRYPRAIGVITSKDGAVWHDILRVIERRYGVVPIILYPCSVQGPSSVKEIITQLKIAATEKKADVYILARGGGSLTDLWSFNTEEVVRAVADFPLPIVSAIGHETDLTLVDFAADLRAPTPSIGAELVTPELVQIYAQLDQYGMQLMQKMLESIRQWESRADRLEQASKPSVIFIAPLLHRIEQYSAALQQNFHRSLQKNNTKLHNFSMRYHQAGAKILQGILRKQNTLEHIAQRNTSYVARRITSLQHGFLQYEFRLAQSNPEKIQHPISIFTEQNTPLHSSLFITPGSTGVIQFPDGKWKVQFIELMD